jgi:hypothetical protein
MGKLNRQNTTLKSTKIKSSIQAPAKCAPARISGKGVTIR